MDKVLISQEQIKQRVGELAAIINHDYQDKEVVVVGVLTGAFMFLTDLLKEIRVSIERVEFISISSYEDATESSGNIRMYLDLKKDIQNKHVLIVEDIVDTGLTITRLLEIFEGRRPASIKLASLLYKPAREKYKVKIDYLGFTIDNHFVYGYGLDLFGKCRHIPYVAIYSGEVKE